MSSTTVKHMNSPLLFQVKIYMPEPVLKSSCYLQTAQDLEALQQTPDQAWFLEALKV